MRQHPTAGISVILTLSVSILFTSTAFGMAKVPSSVVEIQQEDNEFRFMRNGEEYFVKGAGGTRYMDKLVVAGGNSVRAWMGTQEALDEAEKHGLSVCFGLPLLKPRSGFDYTDPEVIEQQLDSIREKIYRYRDHPALLMWAIGNEAEMHASEEERARVWKAINDIAKMIKQIDKDHPVITVTSGFGNDKFIELNEYCPDLDAVGVNTYGKIARVPDEIKRQNWTKPYFVTEFGPRGWWEVDTTSWGIPIEGTSSEKAAFYGMGYDTAVNGNKQCLGSYVFLWGDKQEKTHTWFNLFLPEGNPTAIVDVMSRAWTGEWPANRAPAIGPEKMTVVSDKTKRSEGHIFKPNTKLICKVNASDPNGDEMTIKWDIRIDGATNESVGGDHEPSIKPIEGLVLSTDGKTAVIKTPAEPGMYRIFVYAYDTAGAVGTANVPILVEPQSAEKQEPVIYLASNLKTDTYTLGEQWKLVWTDEFDGDTLNRENWNFQVLEAGRFNGELQEYTDSEQNAYVEDGCLVIQAIHKSDVHGPNQYSSARLNTAQKQTWKYGRIAARIQLPYGEGVFPAFWMLGANCIENGGDTPWPLCGEIDIVELFGNKNDAVVEANIHYADEEDAHDQMGSVPLELEEGIFADQFHVFEIEWDENCVVWMADGKEYARRDITTEVMKEFHQEFFILLNFAVGGTWAGCPDETTHFPQHMYVDWVKVYQKEHASP